MAKGKPATRDENAAAAIDQIDTAAVTLGKAAGTLKRRIEALEELLGEADAKLADAVASAEKEKTRAAEIYTRDTEALKTRLAAAEEKLRKVQATFA